jgi:hypothetical protein
MGGKHQGALCGDIPADRVTDQSAAEATDKDHGNSTATFPEPAPRQGYDSGADHGLFRSLVAKAGGLL